MKCKLLRFTNTPVEFDINNIISITAHGNLIYVKITECVTHVGYCIVKSK